MHQLGHTKFDCLIRSFKPRLMLTHLKINHLLASPYVAHCGATVHKRIIQFHILVWSTRYNLNAWTRWAVARGHTSIGPCVNLWMICMACF